MSDLVEPKNSIQKVIDGKRYNVSTATHLATKIFQDQSKKENLCRVQLYKTRSGSFFQVVFSPHQEEHKKITPLSETEAKNLYESTSDHNVDYAEAFEITNKESLAGRPALYGKRVKKASITLTEEQLAWLKSQGNMSDVIRSLIQKEMESKN